MTSRPRRKLVGAVFANRHAASAAAEDLRRAGFGDEELETAEWLEGRYVIASHAGRMMWRSLWLGTAIGAIGVGLIGAVATVLLWQQGSTITALIVGGVAGIAAGGVIGAYFGLVRHRPQLWYEEDWAHLEVEEGEVLIVVDAEQQPEAVREIFLRHDGQHVEPVHPD